MCSAWAWGCPGGRTQGVVQVLLAHQFQVLFNGLGGDGVLSEDQDVMVPTTVHLRHHQVSEEVLGEECEVSREQIQDKILGA